MAPSSLPQVISSFHLTWSHLMYFFFLSVIKYLVKATSNRKGFLSLAHSLRHGILVEKEEGGTWSSCLYCVWSQEESNARMLLSSLSTYTGPDPSEAVTHNGRIFSLNNTIKVIPKGHAEQLISRWFQIRSRWQHWSSHCQKCQSFPYTLPFCLLGCLSSAERILIIGAIACQEKHSVRNVANT